jgi:hypothetical protein
MPPADEETWQRRLERRGGAIGLLEAYLAKDLASYNSSALVTAQA